MKTSDYILAKKVFDFSNKVLNQINEQAYKEFPGTQGYCGALYGVILNTAVKVLLALSQSLNVPILQLQARLANDIENGINALNKDRELKK
jgi:hypothetical protein